MTDKKQTIPFKRKIDTVKDIVNGNLLNNPEGKESLLRSLIGINSVESLFSKETSFNPGNNEPLYSVNLENLETGTKIDPGLFSSKLFPSDFVKILADFATIFSKKDLTLKTYSGLKLVKSWGNHKEYKPSIDETAFIEYLPDIKKLLGLILAAYSANPKLITEEGTKTEDKDDSDSGKGVSKNKGQDDEDKDQTGETGDEENTSPEDEIADQKTEAKDKQKTKSAVVPPSPNNSKTFIPLSQLENACPPPLTKHERDGLALKEISKLHAQAIGRMFGAYGIDMYQDKSIISTNLYHEISNYFYDLPPQDQAKFITLSSLGRSITVGKSALREKFLSKVYEKFRDNAANEAPLTALYKEIQENPQKFKGLDGSNLAEFKQFHSSFISNKAATIILPDIDVATTKEQTSPEDQLKDSLEKIIPTIRKDLDNKNIETILETLILQNEDKGGPSIDLNGVETKISSMNKEQLASFFGIPSIKGMDYLELRDFKGAIATYTARKTVEISLSTNNPRVLGNKVSTKESKRNKPITKHLSFTSVRDSTKEHGAETTANALNYNRKDRKKEVEKIAKQYKSFFGLWENLSAKEQRQVYNKFNIAYDKNMDKDRKLMFVPEFLFFDVGSLKSFGNSITTEQKATYDEFLEANQTYLKQIGDQMVAEEQYGQFLRDSYLFYTQEHQTLLIADYLASQNEGIELTGYPDEAYFDQFSLNQITNADQYIQDPSNNYALSENGQRFSRQNNFIRRFGKRLGRGKINSPSSKMDKALKSKINKGLTSVINKLPPGWGTTALKIIRKIGLKRTGMIIAGALGALIGGLLSLLFRLFPGWMRSMFGLGGSEAGITAANMATTNATATQAGTAVADSLANSAITDATAAEALANSSANAAVQAAATKLASGATIASASGVFFGLPIALLAPGIAMFIGLAVTMHTIFTIQSAFLVATPPGLDGYSSGGSTQSYNCDAASLTKPTNEGVIMSPDGKYAYPMINSTGTDQCYHWDYSLAIDIYTGHKEPTDPQRNLPLVAYTSGTIKMVVPNDSLGGLYIIMQGNENDSGRYYYYAHLCTSYVQNGQEVVAGEVIGTSNRSGLNAEVTPEHLHFAIQEGGVSPQFSGGGNICPFTDFREKFNMISCPEAWKECISKEEEESL